VSGSVTALQTPIHQLSLHTFQRGIITLTCTQTNIFLRRELVGCIKGDCYVESNRSIATRLLLRRVEHFCKRLPINSNVWTRTHCDCNDAKQKMEPILLYWARSFPATAQSGYFEATKPGTIRIFVSFAAALDQNSVLSIRALEFTTKSSHFEIFSCSWSAVCGGWNHGPETLVVFCGHLQKLLNLELRDAHYNNVASTD
jgi:hypothetical protein